MLQKAAGSMPQKMDNAGLNRHLQKDGDDGFREALSPSTMAMRMSTPRVAHQPFVLDFDAQSVQEDKKTKG